MTLSLYAHPFSSYCQKVLCALYENATPFTLCLVEFDDSDTTREFTALWPVGRMPVLVDAGHTVVESSIIIEHLQNRHPGPVRLIPADPETALDVRKLDRIFDNYVMTPMQAIVFDAMRPADQRDAGSVAKARTLLDTAYDWIDRNLQDRHWAAGEDFTLADCAAAPALFYADWVHPIGAEWAALRDYRARLLARPSFARAVDEARPYRHFFPPGAPDRD